MSLVKMFKVGIDFDDVLAAYVEVCVELCNEMFGTSYTKYNITKWGTDGSPAIRDVSKFYGTPESYALQKVLPEAIKFMNKLRGIADVYIITAMPPLLMSTRAAQIKAAFPDFPDDHILMGSAKNLVQFDITLDDGPHNVLKSGAKFPVLFRQPWNHDLSGVLAVNTYDEFLTLVQQVKMSMVETKPIPPSPHVIALVGPSGSRKKEVVDLIRERKIATPIFSFDPQIIDESVSTITDSIYGGKRYTMMKSNFDYTLNKLGENVVCAVDMAGAMALKREYPTIIVFCKRSREDMIFDVVSREEMSNEEKTIRLLSMEQELRNEKLCDFSVRTEDVTKAVDEIVSFIS